MSYEGVHAKCWRDLQAAERERDEWKVVARRWEATANSYLQTNERVRARVRELEEGIRAAAKTSRSEQRERWERLLVEAETSMLTEEEMGKVIAESSTSYMPYTEPALCTHGIQVQGCKWCRSPD